MPKIHICNEAADLIPEEKHHAHHMYEDHDLHGYDCSEDFYAWLDKHAPGQFILISTGDYIVPEGCKYQHRSCETYDPECNLYIVPVAVWEACKDTVMAKDAQWRKEANQCSFYSNVTH